MTDVVARDEPLLSLRDVSVAFPVRSVVLNRTIGRVEAVAGVSFDINRGEVLGLVGESGSGKSTIARTIVGLHRATSGLIRFAGQDLSSVSAQEMRDLRRNIQMIFQDPYTSLNPRRTVWDIVKEAWEVHPDVVPRARWRAEFEDLIKRVGLSPDHGDRYPHQFSGGQRQRISIARALALRPQLIICDEPVSALDVSIQAQIVNLLQDLQEELGLTYLFIAHDLSVVRHISNRVAVMYLGKIVEVADKQELFEQPTHPYTQALISAVPRPDAWRIGTRNRIVLTGDIPSPAWPPSGCRFRTRCWKAQTKCTAEEPSLETRAGLHPSACHFASTESGILPPKPIGGLFGEDGARIGTRED